jgi:rhodanese-related sulfurtransferase
MDKFSDLRHFRPDELKPLLEKGINLLDLRPAADFCNGFIPDSVFVPDSWMHYQKLKMLLQPGLPVVVIPGNDSSEVIRVFKIELRDQLLGIAESGFEGWVEAQNPLDIVISVDAEELGFEIKFGEPQIVDMRVSEKAFKDQHIAGAEYIPGVEMLDRFTEIQDEKTVYLYDEDGEGALAVISFLKKHGLHFFYNLNGGFQAALSAGLPMESAVQKN